MKKICVDGAGTFRTLNSKTLKPITMASVLFPGLKRTLTFKDGDRTNWCRSNLSLGVNRRGKAKESSVYKETTFAVKQAVQLGSQQIAVDVTGERYFVAEYGTKFAIPDYRPQPT